MYYIFFETKTQSRLLYPPGSGIPYQFKNAQEAQNFLNSYEPYLKNPQNFTIDRN